MFQGFLGRGVMRASMLVSCLLLPAVTASAQQPSYFNQASKTAFVNSTSVVNRPFVVNVGSRVILPGTNRALDFSRGRTEAFVQFTEPLTPARRMPTQPCRR